MDWNLIFDNENIVGFSWDVERYIQFVLSDELDPDDEDDHALFGELLEELAKHDGLVRCDYHPMGAYFVSDLIVKGEE